MTFLLFTALIVVFYGRLCRRQRYRARAPLPLVDA